MNIMVRKGYLQRAKKGRAFEFTPVLEEDSVGQSMVQDLLSRVFDGSAHSLVLQLLETSDVDVSSRAPPAMSPKPRVPSAFVNFSSGVPTSSKCSWSFATTSGKTPNTLTREVTP